MKKFFIAVFSFFLVSVSTSNISTYASDNVKKQKEITILGTADLHGFFYNYNYPLDKEENDKGLAKVATIVKKERELNPNLLLVDNGDTVQDNMAYIFNNDPVHTMILGLNYLNYDAWVLGNHEFNFGLDFLRKQINEFNGDVLSANIIKENDDYFVKPYSIYDIDGVKVAIVGLTTPNVPRWEASNPEHFKGLKFEDTLVSTEKVLKELKGEADVIIGAFHIGKNTEYQETDGVKVIAEHFPEFSAILVGHEHDTFDNLEVNGVKLIEPGSRGSNVAKISIKLEKQDDNWTVKNVQTKNIKTDGVEADQDFLDNFKDKHEKALKEINKVIGKVGADFIKRPDYITGEDKVTTMPTAQLEPTALIEFINKVQMFYTKADISAAALFSSNSNLKAGDFKVKDASNIYKFDNTLLGVEMSGENLKKYMEWSANYYNTFKPGDITVSFNPEVRNYNYDMFYGIDYDIDISKPSGERIQNVTINDEPLDPAKTYKVAINNYRLGTLISLNLVSLDDIYYDSSNVYSDSPEIRALIIKYVQEELKDKTLEPTVTQNWKIIGADLDETYKEKVFNLVKDKKIVIPRSEDGRTPNVKSLNVFELKDSGIL